MYVRDQKPFPKHNRHRIDLLYMVFCMGKHAAGVVYEALNTQN